MIRSAVKSAFRLVINGFDGGLEDYFKRDYYRSSLPIVRVALVLGIILYGAFGILDIWVVPVSKDLIWIIRFAIVIPVITAVLVLSFFDIFERFFQPLAALVALIAGIGIVTMIGIARPEELGFNYYYAGLMLVIMWAYVLVRMRFKFATPVSWIITAAYEIVAVAFNGMLESPEKITVFINNNFFFISANIIGMVTSFTLEFFIRKNFLLRDEIERAFTMNKRYLDTITEGLVLIDPKFNIPGQYSRFMLELFSRKSIEGTNFVDLVFPDIPENAGSRTELEKFLKLLFTNTTADMDMLLDINPLVNRKLSIAIDRYTAREIIITANFIRVGSRGTVEFLLVVIQDRTAIARFEEELEAEKALRRKDIESISAILDMGPAAFLDFLGEAHGALERLEENFMNLGEPETVNAVFRDLHSLKGLARHLELHELSTTAHLLEDDLDAIRKNGLSRDSRQIAGIRTLARSLENDIMRIDDLIAKFSSFSEIGTNTNENQMASFFETVKKMVRSMGESLGKNVELTVSLEVPEIPHFAKLKPAIIHAVRNAVDHGIEDSFQRLSEGKTETGVIAVRVYRENEHYCVEIRDDGSGIDFKRIKEKAIASGFLEPDAEAGKSKLLSILFAPGFSSRETVTEYSGRGVGLDAVKETVEELGGQIKVSTHEKRGTKITLVLPG